MAAPVQHTLPPGRYFVGDPSMVLDKQLENVLRSTDFFNGSEPVTIRGTKLWAMRGNTLRPKYSDQNGVEYRVNDGVLGAVSLDIVEDPHGEEFGTIIDAPNGLQVRLALGVFYFNDIMINTNDPRDTDFDNLADGGYDLDPDLDRFI